MEYRAGCRTFQTCRRRTVAAASELGLWGLGRGESAGRLWADVDLDAKTLTIGNNRVSAGGRTTENEVGNVAAHPAAARAAGGGAAGGEGPAGGGGGRPP